MSHHLVVARDLRYRYPDGTSALDGITFRIVHGESVGIVGANGAGKSTLLLHLNGTLLPASGEVRIGEELLTPDRIPEVRRRVGMIFQDPDDQLFMPTVGSDVAFGPLNMGLPESDVRERVASALERVGLLGLEARPPHRLSGGEKRRAALATVLAMSPDLLVLDEPSAGLDPHGRRALIGLLREFTHTKIVATHDLDLVLDLCERTIVLDRGIVRADGLTREIFQDDALLASCRLEKPLSMQGCPVCGISRAAGRGS
jgi:cobalt/nickel transport system ATP-binding protein